MGTAKTMIDGANPLIDEALRLTGIGKSPHYAHRKAWQRLGSKPAEFDPRALVKDLYGCIEKNWSPGRRASPQNWRLKRCPTISAHNRSSEVQLERRIARLKDEAWPANQVPVASGVFGSHEDKRRAVDLVYQCPEHAGRACYALIELKTESDTPPLYAAFEILLYGLIYLFSRCHMRELGYDRKDQPLLGADSIHLRVLASNQFYKEGPSLGWLERDLSDAIRRFAKTKRNDLVMDFSFRASPWLLSDKDLLKHLEQAGKPYG